MIKIEKSTKNTFRRKNSIFCLKIKKSESIELKIFEKNDQKSLWDTITLRSRHAVRWNNARKSNMFLLKFNECQIRFSYIF